MPILLTSHKPKTQQIDFAALQEQIRCRAHELYEQRNRTDRHALDDWLQAEAELTGTTTQQPLELGFLDTARNLALGPGLDQWVAYDGWHCTVHDSD